jgi:hypothetical protein
MHVPKPLMLASAFTHNKMLGVCMRNGGATCVQGFCGAVGKKHEEVSKRQNQTSERSIGENTVPRFASQSVCMQELGPHCIQRLPKVSAF